MNLRGVGITTEGYHKAVLEQVELEKKYDDQFKIVFEAIAELMAPKDDDPKEIGFQLKEGDRKHGKK